MGEAPCTKAALETIVHTLKKKNFSATETNNIDTLAWHILV